MGASCATRQGYEPIPNHRRDRVSTEVHIWQLDKPFLRLREAAELACVGETKFRELARDLGISAILWGGVNVYRRTDIIEAMEAAAWQQSGSVGSETKSIGDAYNYC